MRIVTLAAFTVAVLAFTTEGPSAERPRPTAPADSVEVANLQAFAALYGAVRFFHPSDQAAETDWDRFAALGASRVLDARTPDDLRRALASVFGPVAPSIAVYRSADGPPVLAQWLDAADVLVAWQHLGVGLGNPGPVYQSVRLGRRPPVESAPFGLFVRGLDASPLQGRRVRLSATVAAERGQAQLWLRVDRPEPSRGFFDNMDDRPITDAAAVRYTVEGPVADDAVGLAFGGFVLQGGAARFSDVTLEATTAGGDWEPIPLADGAFDAPDAADGWALPSAGYVYDRVAEADGTPALRLATSTATGPARDLFAERPAPGETVTLDLGRGLSARVPVAVASRDGQTAPAPDPDALAALRTALAEVDPSDGGRATRAADVIAAAAVFEHFYPYADLVDLDWRAVRAQALAAALAAETPRAHCRALRVLVAHLRDGHGNVGCAGLPAPARLPFLVDRVEGRVAVVAADDASEVHVGDVVVSVDGADASAELDSLSALVSGSPQWRLWRAAREFGAGAEGSTARVEVERAGQRIVRSVPRDVGPAPAEARPEPIAELRPGVLYVDIERVSDSLLTTRMPDVVAADGVVFDFRGYPRQLGPWFLAVFADRPIVSALWEVPRTLRPGAPGGAGADTSRWAPMPPAEPHARGRAVFLTDGRAISYAESILGIVDHYGLGTTVGGPTAGANGNINPFVLPGGHRVTWTGMRVRRHDGATLHGVGIAPDVPVRRTLAGLRAGRDEALDRAAEIAAGAE
ncbi:S41 family peptidase [Rubrivirga sp. IMCC45206]|uniref:S41 family peptidase n=1 Tax=Rubrivirga sp. IMCC45206 TaxID=3391614 RepID=UPI00398FE27F